MSGTDNMGWISDPSNDVWKEINNAVHDTEETVSMAQKFLPLVPWTGDPNETKVYAQFINPETLVLDELDTVNVLELSITFDVPITLAADEGTKRSTRTSAVNGARLLALARDLLIFQGTAGTGSLSKKVSLKGKPDREGLSETKLTAPVTPTVTSPTKIYGLKTVEAVANAYSQLQALGYPGPYALVLPQDRYADANTPIGVTSSLTPADTIRAYVTDGDKVHFYGTGGLPGNRGLFVSLGAYLIDWVVLVPPTTVFTQKDGDENYQFRLKERFALRLKVNGTAPKNSPIVKLDFQ
jgi:uncharacterized linocin/CFP29 family protein